MAYERLQKLIARAGIAARRKAEELIVAGRVSVNGQIVRELGAKADPEKDKIEFDGRRVDFPRAPTYIVMWKPAGVVTSSTDDLGRRTVFDLVQAQARVFPVGQLDYDTEGVLLLTDDGNLAQALTRPGAMLQKTYRCRLKTFVGADALQKLKEGVELEDGVVGKANEVRVLVSDEGPRRSGAWLELKMDEAPNHLIRKMLHAVGHMPLTIRRVAYGPLDLEGLRPGKWRNLRRDELARLKGAANALRKKSRANQQNPQ